MAFIVLTLIQYSEKIHDFRIIVVVYHIYNFPFERVKTTDFTKTDVATPCHTGVKNVTQDKPTRKKYVKN